MNIENRIRQIPRLANMPGITELARIIGEEFRQLSAEISLQAHQNALEFAQMLVPESMDRPIPAFGLATFSMKEQEELDIEMELAADLGDYDFTFTPVYRGRSYPVRLRFICLNDRLWDTQQLGLPEIYTLNHPLNSFLGLALESKTELTSLDGLQLCFSGVSNEALQALLHARLYCNRQAYRLLPAGLPSMKHENKVHPCDREYLFLTNLRKKIADITADMGLFRLQAINSNFFPPAFNPESHGLSLPEDIDSLNWLQVYLPDCLTLQSLAECVVSVNVFPVWNAWKARRTENITNENRSEVIIPLTSNTNQQDDQNPAELLALARIWSRPKHPYTPKALFPKRTGTYILGNRNPAVAGSIDLKGMLDALTYKLNRTDPLGLAVLASDNQDVLQPDHEAIRQFSKLWEDIRPRINRLQKKDYYLKIHPQNNEDILYVDIWKTNPVASDIMWPVELSLSCTIPALVDVKMVATPNQTKNLISDTSDPIIVLQDRLFPNKEITIQ